MRPKSLKEQGFVLLRWIWRRRALVIAVGVAIAAAGGWAGAQAAGVGWGVAIAAGSLLFACSAVVAAAAALKLRVAFVEVSSAIDALRRANNSVLEKMEEMRRVDASIREKIEELQRKSRDQQFVLEERSNSLSVKLARVEKNLGPIDDAKRAGKTIGTVTERLTEHSERLQQLQTMSKRQGHALEVHAAEMLAQFKKVDNRLSTKVRPAALDEVAQRVSDLAVRVDGYHVHPRSLSKADIGALRSEWAKPLGLSHTDTSLGYLAARVRTIESISAGRLATASSTMIARLLAAQAIGGPTLRILEIGALFGVASACFYNACVDRYGSVHLTLLDPLDGYYGKDADDVITGAPVTRATVERNLAAAGVPRQAYEIVQKFSTDDDALAVLASREFDLLLIDGDHSYEGVKWDYQKYGPLVRSGGIILFDDYGVKEWPDIKRFVDETPAEEPSLQLIAKGFRTAAFRVATRLARP